MGTKSRLIQVEVLEDMINYQIYRMARIMRYKFQHDMKNDGIDITQEQYFVLFRLWKKDGQYQTQLADDLFGDTPNITRILDVMEKKCFITRQPDPNDRRKYRIFLAEGGRKFYEVYKSQAPKSRNLDYDKLDDRDLDNLKQMFGTIEANIVAQLQVSATGVNP
jgi:MarR family transcriptional regulator for hemolysin